jgi:hypothetical protein
MPASHRDRVSANDLVAAITTAHATAVDEQSAARVFAKTLRLLPRSTCCWAFPGSSLAGHSVARSESCTDHRPHHHGKSQWNAQCKCEPERLSEADIARPRQNDHRNQHDRVGKEAGQYARGDPRATPCDAGTHSASDSQSDCSPDERAERIIESRGRRAYIGAGAAPGKQKKPRRETDAQHRRRDAADQKNRHVESRVANVRLGVIWAIVHPPIFVSLARLGEWRPPRYAAFVDQEAKRNLRRKWRFERWKPNVLLFFRSADPPPELPPGAGVRQPRQPPPRTPPAATDRPPSGK